MILIIKKEKYKKQLSVKMIKKFRHRGIRYLICKIYWKIRGYEVENISEKEVENL